MFMFWLWFLLVFVVLCVCVCVLFVLLKQLCLLVGLSSCCLVSFGNHIWFVLCSLVRSLKLFVWFWFVWWLFRYRGRRTK